jgi:hypothetical protein
MDGLPFQLPTQVGTELFPDAMQAPPIMRITVEAPGNAPNKEVDPRQGSDENSYGMEDGESPKTPGDNVPIKDPGSVRSEAVFVATQVVEKAHAQINGWYLGQSYNAAMSGLATVKTSTTFSWGHATYTKAVQMSMLELTVSSYAVNAEFERRHNLFNDLLAVQFEGGAD